MDFLTKDYSVRINKKCAIPNKKMYLCALLELRSI